MKKKRLSRRGRRGRKLGGDERDGEGQGVKTRGIKEGWRLFPLYNFFVLVEGLALYILDVKHMEAEQ
jgi:hypothetical protein